MRRFWTLTAILLCLPGLGQRVSVVRVGLVSMGSPARFQVTAKAPFAAYDVSTGTSIGEWRAGEVAQIYADGARVRVGGVSVNAAYFGADADRMQLITDGKARNYRGWLYFGARDGKLAAVNEVGLEMYLMSVVPSEMSPSAPLQALRAQAIAARTYTIHKIGAFDNEGFDVDDTTRSHTYRGADVEDARTNEAVRTTSNMILVYKGKPINAMYAAVSGGTTAGSAEVFGGSEPYLAGIKDVDENGRPYAADNKDFYWSKLFDGASFQKLFPKLSATVSDVAILGRTPSGRVSALEFSFADGSKIQIPCSKLRQALGYDILRSTLFDISKTPAGWRFDGKGWGHGVGMCQAGAVGRARAGQTAEQMLKIYYTGAEIVLVRGSAVEMATRGGSKVERKRFSKVRGSMQADAACCSARSS